jgi:prepilin peptidase CpaA
MDLRELLGFLPMLVLLAWAAVVDIRTRRIPNWMTGALVISGLVQSGLAYWSLTTGQALAGLGVGFGLTFILFAIGAMGGGDVKMFAGIGAWVGPFRIFEIFAAAALVGMVIVIFQAIQGQRMRALLRNSTVIVLNAAVAGDLSCPEEPPQDPAGPRRLPKAVPTLAATLLVLLSGRRWL